MSIFSRQIEAFRAVMLTGGMTAAAETLLITQPAVSRLIRDLETDLAIGLFHRKGNQITPTAEANAFFAEVERRYLGMEQLRTYAKDLTQSLSGSLRIAAMPALANTFLPHCLASFTKSRPNLSILLEGIPSHLVLEQIAGGQSELGFTERFIDHPMLSVTPIAAQAMVVLPQGHRLAKFKVLSPKHLADEKVILLSHRSHMRHAIENVLGTKLRNTGTIETPLSAIACELVAQGMGVTIVEPFTAVSFLKHGVEVRPVQPEIKVTYSMVTSRHRPVSRLVQDFSNEVLRLVDEYLSPLSRN